MKYIQQSPSRFCGPFVDVVRRPPYRRELLFPWIRACFGRAFSSLGSFSQPSGSVSSEAPAEMVASTEPPGQRKISTRKSRAARLSPMEGRAAIRQHTMTPLYSGHSSKQRICWEKLVTDNGYFNCHVEC